MNNQAPESLAAPRKDGAVEVNSIFHTIQGEGPFAGCPAVFIRLAGCNLQCPLCDTEYTKRSVMCAEEIVDAVGSAHRGKDCALVVITGGEPFRQDISALVAEAQNAGYHVQIETNGTLPPSKHLPGGVDIVCSPKTGTVHKQLLPRITAYKYVAEAGALCEDGLPRTALQHPAPERGVCRPPDNTECLDIYLQPADMGDAVKNAANLEAVKESVLQHSYRLCLQQHKIIAVP